MQQKPGGTVLPFQLIEILSSTVEIKHIFSGTVATPRLLQLKHKHLCCITNSKLMCINMTLHVC